MPIKQKRVNFFNNLWWFSHGWQNRNIIASIISTQKTNLREQLSIELYKYLLLFYQDQATKLSEHQKFDYRIEVLGKPKKGLIYWLIFVEQQALQEHILSMLVEGKIHPSSSSAGLLVLFVPKNNKKEL
jgi:hypothetical protein